MNKYRLTALTVAAIVGVSAGTATALNTDRRDAAAPTGNSSSAAPPPSGGPSPTPSEEVTPPNESDTSDTGPSDTGTNSPDPGPPGGDEGTAEYGKYLLVEVGDHERIASGDPSAQPMLIGAQVCVAAVPAEDSDGLVEVGYNNFTIEQEGPEAISGPPWVGLSAGVLGDDDTAGFPERALLAEGECADGLLPFLVGRDIDSTALRFSHESVVSQTYLYE